MPVNATIRRLLIVEARDLDTDERDRRELEVAAPLDETAQRIQLADVVARLHPAARMRSFGGDAASFLDRENLVVAHYGPPLEPVTKSPGEGRAAEQQPLFPA